MTELLKVRIHCFVWPSTECSFGSSQTLVAMIQVCLFEEFRDVMIIISGDSDVRTIVRGYSRGSRFLVGGEIYNIYISRRIAKYAPASQGYMHVVITCNIN